MLRSKFGMRITSHHRPGKRATRHVGYHREQLKAAIRMRGTTLSALSRAHGYAPEACSIALRRPWRAVEEIIADFLGVPAAAIWPERRARSKKERS